MKLHYLDRTSLSDCSFTIKRNNYPYFLRLWHYHPELELVLINSSTGTRFIGDNIERFKKNEVVLIGENLPHMWLNDDIYFEESSTHKAEAIAIHFKKEFLGLPFLQVPEMKHLRKLLDTAIYGINFRQLDKETILKIKNLDSKQHYQRLMSLLDILNDLANHPDQILLSSKGYVTSFNKTNNRNMDKAYEYIFKNFNKSIFLDEVAAIANMNPSAFSRFFKRINRKTFKQYVNEIRIGYACKLLTENQHNITHICYDSGFNNISNFNRQFKKITGKSPSEYLKFHTNPKNEP